MVQKRPRQVELGTESFRQCLHPERFCRVVPRVEDVQPQLFGIEERVVSPFARDVGVEAQGGGLPDHRARRPGDDADAPHALRPERHQPGATAHDVHRAVSAGFTQRGYHLGHVTGHSIGMTMIEHPKIGEGVETELATNMVFSMHPHAIAADGRECLYMQDTWLVTEDGGVPLADLEMRIW